MADETERDLARSLEQAAPRARRLLGSAGAAGGPERAGRGLEGSRPRVGPPDEEDARSIARQLKRSATTLEAAAVGGRDPAREADAMAADLVARARAVMARLESGAVDGAIGAEDVLALESVLRTRGRPALKVEGDRIEAIDAEKHPGSEFWRILLDDHDAALVAVTGATGAVVVRDILGGTPPWVQGTAWLVRGDRVVTNRHVLFPPLGGMRLARRRPGAMTTARFKSDFEVSIDFAFDDGPVRALRNAALEVLFVAEESDPVDVAVIRVAPPAGVAAAPGSLALAEGEFDSDQLYVVGHPGRMPGVPEEVLAVFGTPDERKRLSLGELMDPDPRRPGEILHDASTIGGYSGGCVLGFRSREVAALHYFGDPANGNRAIVADALRNHPVAEFLSL